MAAPKPEFCLRLNIKDIDPEMDQYSWEELKRIYLSKSKSCPGNDTSLKEKLRKTVIKKGLFGKMKPAPSSSGHRGTRSNTDYTSDDFLHTLMHKWYPKMFESKKANNNKQKNIEAYHHKKESTLMSLGQFSDDNGGHQPQVPLPLGGHQAAPVQFADIHNNQHAQPDQLVMENQFEQGYQTWVNEKVPEEDYCMYHLTKN